MQAQACNFINIRLPRIHLCIFNFIPASGSVFCQPIDSRPKHFLKILKVTGAVYFFKNLLRKQQRNTTIVVSTKVSIKEKHLRQLVRKKIIDAGLGLKLYKDENTAFTSPYVKFICRSSPLVVLSVSQLIEDLSTFLKGTGGVGFFCKFVKKREKKHQFCCLQKKKKRIYKRTTHPVVGQEENNRSRPRLEILLR